MNGAERADLAALPAIHSRSLHEEEHMAARRRTNLPRGLREQLEKDPAGELMPEDDKRRPIPPALRKRLEDILGKPRVRRPRLEEPDIAHILDGVREALQNLTVLRQFPDPASHWARFER